MSEFQVFDYVIIIFAIIILAQMVVFFLKFEDIDPVWIKFGYLIPFGFVFITVLYYLSSKSIPALVITITHTILGAVFQYYYRSKERNLPKKENNKSQTKDERKAAFEKEEQEYKEYRYKTEFQKGKAAYDAKKYKKAAEYFVGCLAIHPDAAEPWYYIGLTNTARDRIPEAKKAFNEALRRNRNYEKAKSELKALLKEDTKSEE